MKTNFLLLFALVFILQSFAKAQNSYSYWVYDGTSVSIHDNISKENIQNEDALYMRWQDYHGDKGNEKIFIEFNESELDFVWA